MLRPAFRIAPSIRSIAALVRVSVPVRVGLSFGLGGFAALWIGFQIYLPFLILDLVVSSVTISMGMMMLPPVMISLPLKLLLFVLVDGWTLVVGMLLESFG